MQSTNQTQPGYVYVKTHAKNGRGLHKIGLTRRPEQREQQLGGDDCVVLCRVLVNDPEGLEDRLHRAYDAERLPQTEYFNLSPEQVHEVLVELVTAHEECLKHVVLPDLSEQTPQPSEETEEGHWDPGAGYMGREKLNDYRAKHGFLSMSAKQAEKYAEGRPIKWVQNVGFCLAAESYGEQRRRENSRVHLSDDLRTATKMADGRKFSYIPGRGFCLE